MARKKCRKETDLNKGDITPLAKLLDRLHEHFLDFGFLDTDITASDTRAAMIEPLSYNFPRSAESLALMVTPGLSKGVRSGIDVKIYRITPLLHVHGHGISR